jgi:hypothetical protein
MVATGVESFPLNYRSDLETVTPKSTVPCRYADFSTLVAAPIHVPFPARCPIDGFAEIENAVAVSIMHAIGGPIPAFNVLAAHESR